MELSSKIQKLRKERGLTQEQFAQQLFVSRTAVSKWETGRGTPNIESLKMIAGLCEVTLDDLLGTEEIIAVAKNENRENINRFAAYVDAVFNIASVMGLFLPLYKVEADGLFLSVPLYRFEGWLALLYWLAPIAMAACGAIQMLLCGKEGDVPRATAGMIGMILNAGAVFLFILSGQPYPAAMFFALLLTKGAVASIKHT